MPQGVVEKKGGVMTLSLDSGQPAGSSAKNLSFDAESNEKRIKELNEKGQGVPLLGAMGAASLWPLGFTAFGAVAGGYIGYTQMNHTKFFGYNTTPTVGKILDTTWSGFFSGCYGYFLGNGLRVAAQAPGGLKLAESFGIPALTQAASAWASGTTVGAATASTIGITVAAGLAIGVAVGTGINYLPKAFGAKKTVGDHIGDWMTETLGPADRNGNFFKACEFLGLA